MSVGFNEPFVWSPKSNQATYAYRGGKGMFNSAEWHVFFDDFNGAVTSNVPNGWAGAIIDVGCTITNAGLHGGVLLFDSDAANEGASCYLNKCIKLAGKKFFMEARVKMEDVSAMTFQMGLTDVAATTNPEDLWTTTAADGIAFGNLDAATVSLVYDKNNGGPVTATLDDTTKGTLADDTWAVLAIAYDGAATPNDGSLTAWVNGYQVAKAETEAQVPEDVELAPFIGMLAGHATTADVAHVDYVRFAIER